MDRRPPDQSTIDRRTDRSSGMRRALALALLASLAFAGQATAKSFTLPSAHVSVRVAPDGALLVEERITYDFAGAFSGGVREIPVAGGPTIDRGGVSEGGGAYRPRAPRAPRPAARPRAR